MRKFDLRLDLDERCNFKCEYCDNKDQPAEKKHSFPLEELQAVFPVIDKYCWNTFFSCGGEPTMHPQFRDIMELSKQLPHTDLAMVSNGLLLNEKNRQAILDSGLNRLYLSVDTLEPALFAKLCGCRESDFTKVIQNIEALAKEFAKRKDKHLIITSIAMKSTIAGLDKIADWIIAIGAEAMNVQWLNPLEYEYLKAEVLEVDDSLLTQLDGLGKKLEKSAVLFDFPRSRTTAKLKSVWKMKSLYKNKWGFLMDNFARAFSKKMKMPCHLAGNTVYWFVGNKLQMCPYDALPLKAASDNAAIALEQQLLGLRSKLKAQVFDKCKNCSLH